MIDILNFYQIKRISSLQLQIPTMLDQGSQLHSREVYELSPLSIGQQEGIT